MSSQPNSFVQVNNVNPKTPGKKLATYEFLDGADCVESEAVTLTDATGHEVLGPKIATEALPVVVALQASELKLGKETVITGAAVLVIPANPQREAGLVQNTGNANIRVGPAGVTSTTGFRLVPNQTIIYGQPNVNLDEIWAIREGAVDSIAFSQEEVVAWPGSGPPVVPCPPPDEDCECDD